MTLPEFFEMVEGHNKREELELEKMKTQAWINAALIKQSIVCALNKDAKFPELQDILKSKEPQTPEQMEAAFASINAAFGGSVVYTEG